jgi:hypothetical protein
VRACEDRSRPVSDGAGKGGEAILLLQPGGPLRPLLTECDVCGSVDLTEIRCKVICRNCRTILQSCADL